MRRGAVLQYVMSPDLCSRGKIISGGRLEPSPTTPEGIAGESDRTGAGIRLAQTTRWMQGCLVTHLFHNVLAGRDDFHGGNRGPPAYERSLQEADQGFRIAYHPMLHVRQANIHRLLGPLLAALLPLRDDGCSSAGVTLAEVLADVWDGSGTGDSSHVDVALMCAELKGVVGNDVTILRAAPQNHDAVLVHVCGGGLSKRVSEPAQYVAEVKG